METGILTKILDRFVIYLEVLPENLRLFCFSALFFLVTINIALTIYDNLGNENFSYIQWGKKQILKVGFIMFMLYKYEWVLAGVKNFFFYAVEKAIRVSFFSTEYFDNPTLLYAQGEDLANYIYEHGVHWYSIKSWVYIIFYFLILIGFLMLTVQLIICWIEYYFLTGFSMIFLPFGALDMTIDYYKNVFKTIMGATIKIAVMNFWLILSSAIIKDLFLVTKDVNFTVKKAGLIFGVLYVVVAIMQFLPTMTSSLLTGSPQLNAGQAMSAAVSATTGLFGSAGNAIKNAYHLGRGAYETGKGAVQGAKVGANAGETVGGTIGWLGGPIGGGIGQIVGGAIGAVGGATIGGSYAGVKYYATKQESKSEKSEKKDEEHKEETKASSTENKNNSSFTNNTLTEKLSSEKQSSEVKQDSTIANTTNANTNTNNGNTINNSNNIKESTNIDETKISSSTNQNSEIKHDSTAINTSSTNTTNENTINESATTASRNNKTRANLPDWAKNDY